MKRLASCLAAVPAAALLLVPAPAAAAPECPEGWREFSFQLPTGERRIAACLPPA